MNDLNRVPSIDAPYQVSVHLDNQFWRRFLEIDQPETINCIRDQVIQAQVKWELPVVVMFANGSGRN
jgi:hypothetical protein